MKVYERILPLHNLTDKDHYKNESIVCWFLSYSNERLYYGIVHFLPKYDKPAYNLFLIK